jgi:phosphoglycerate dehydrogenase-like enzyme
MSPLVVLEYIRDPEGVWVLPPALLEGLRRAFPYVEFVSPADRAAADAALPGADVVLGYAVRPHNFARARRLRWIQITSAGVGPALFPELAASDVVLTNGRGLYSDAMAEHALAVMLAFARRLHLSRDLQHERRWGHVALRDEAPGFATLDGGTLGIVGFGSIGEALASRARAFGLRVIGLRRTPRTPPDPAHEQWAAGRLHELLARADWVVLAPPLTDETRGMIGAAEIAAMRRHAVLVNLGRGALVDEDALTAALAAGRIGGAGLDVFREEPLPAASPLWTMPNVIVTPHVSGLGPGLWERAMALFARNLSAFLEGRTLENVVDKRTGY